MDRPFPVRARTRDIASDVQSQAISEEPVAAVEARLTDVQRQLDILRAQVRQAQQLAHLGTLAATIAHEVNNLLTPIRSYAQAALDSDDGDLQRKALTVTLRNVDMLVAMTGRILEIGAATTPDRKLTSVRTIAQQAMDSLCRDVSRDGIQFKVDADESIEVFVDPLQLRQVLFNLFLNAWNAMAPSRHGRIVVSAARAAERVEIAVTDTGPGIEPDILKHIFDPLRTTKIASRNGKQRCAGLGLALCHDLVAENDGTIAVKTRAGEGTTFTLSLPAG